MLILTRRIGEKIAIGDDIFLKIIDIQGKQVKMGIDAPKECVIHREEIYERIKDENKGASFASRQKEKVAEASRMASRSETIEFQGQVVPPDAVITIQEGLIGFGKLKRFIIADLAGDPTGPFKWLQSLDDKEFAFLVTDPRFIVTGKEYNIEVAKEDVEDIKLQPGTEDDLPLVILNYDNEGALFANLRAPLLINSKEMLGKQLILDDTSLPTRHLVTGSKNG